ncbi:MULTISPECIES: SDR family NAD(P)-dependent oxidoreductase [Pectobacterium]|uniref:SDR family NAD(P)-dependent oxidoreductase n=1 Tax=Pectobacterium TaxID=122277 RepID=UPI000CFF7D9D|nr:SDR family NAD(P)-dependent oxidoreductase [Pectobacterium versatile]PRI18555.1 short-chain dehydrogenase [Pectobacterium versatile]
MNKVIAIFGAGPGLGKSVALRFGREGYQIALVGRTLASLQSLAVSLDAQGITNATFCADLTHEDNILPLLHEIQKTLGDIEVVYYAPASTEAFLPASTLTVDNIRDRMSMGFISLIAIIHHLLPTMQQRRRGAVLAAFGGNAVMGLPYMSGLATAQAAARNYLYSLQGEVAHDNIHVGIIGISGVIKGSAYHASVTAGTSDAPDFLEMPLIDPDEMAEVLWKASHGQAELETFFPFEIAHSVPNHHHG